MNSFSTLRIITIAVFFAGACLTIFAQDRSASAKDSVATYCVTFENDSTYTARLVRKEILPAKKKPFKGDDQFLNLPRNLISDISPRNVFHLKNAKEILPHYYGQFFRASESKSECSSRITRKEREYNALLVGPCVKSMPVAHYCLIEGKHSALYRTELFENVPEINLFDGTGTEVSNVTCSGTAQKETSTEWDFAEIGKLKLGPYTEEDSCHGKSSWKRKSSALIPEYINLSIDTNFKATSKQLKSFYGKSISAVWNISMECGFEKVKQAFEYEIILTGKCPAFIKPPKTKLKADDFWALNRIKVHGESKTKNCAIKGGLE
ncbi:MAG: hypothetical protein II565_11590 [Fibrobacter sp.]|nr:hypothetical protein [Fibrobacter sp.]